ncbi:MAG: cellobiose phosphorylase [Candidatus Omnitrophota bacterium]
MAFFNKKRDTPSAKAKGVPLKGLKKQYGYAKLLANMNEPLWRFVDDKGTFISENASRLKSLYLPLCNSFPIISSISPDLHGDIKTDYNSYLLEPVSRGGLSNLKTSRNFWIYINPRKAWSATGVSKEANRLEDKFTLEAGLLWQKVTRRNKKIGLRAEITSFVPASGEPAEIMLVDITNISSRAVKFIPTAAIPLFARSAHNLHDHRHVTSLLQRVQKEKYGVIVKPTLIFDESGHKKNHTCYFVLGTDGKLSSPQYIYSTQAEFTGESGDLEAPEAILKNILPAKNSHIQGKESMAGLRFKTCALKPKGTVSYIIVMGITEDKSGVGKIFSKFNNPVKIKKALEENKAYWREISSSIALKTKDTEADNWFKWVNIQPVLRKISGCSFLPDFDYGKGGKGWRDLWQDSLSLILNNPREVRPLLLNNFRGVRIDGSNATIIGKNSGEFIADRNNISRVWMDHGIWPFITTHLYIHQTADLGILSEQTPYFRDRQLSRSKELDPGWSPEHGNLLKAGNNEVYYGTVLEHILVQNLVQFFNVGEHNHISLEGADWNDGLDMGYKHGESVAFSCMYAQNLASLAQLLERLDTDNVIIFKELAALIDSITQGAIDYSDAKAKRGLLERYFRDIKCGASLEKITIPRSGLIKDLNNKSEWMRAHIKNSEWLKEGFFNGYYNNDKERLEGNINGVIRMTLAGQAFAVMSGIADKTQTGSLLKNVDRYLKDKRSGGIHLNTDFKKEQLNMGRAFSFIYGDKENGAFFSHMSVMFAYALYKQGFAREGFEVLNSIYKMAVDTPKSKIYPCLPEYFNAEGRGMYSYLTGSASWYILTLLTQSFGIRGEYGDLVIEPKLTFKQFGPDKKIAISTSFAGKPLEVRFINPGRKDFGVYSINKVSINWKTIAENIKKPRFLIHRSQIASLSNNINTIEVILD